MADKQRLHRKKMLDSFKNKQKTIKKRTYNYLNNWCNYT